MLQDHRCLIVAPHPDDEIIGAGIWLRRRGNRNLTILHLTDGSPRRMDGAQAAGFFSREDYAAERREELYGALALAGVTREQCRRFDFVDQELHLNLRACIDRLEHLIAELRPEMVLAPAYEGGHPDHDSAAFAVAMVSRSAGMDFRRLEYRLYHSAPDGGIDSGEFLPERRNPVRVLHLSGPEVLEKERMIRMFPTQRRFLERLDLDSEAFRDAPDYDFRHPPHEGRLLYERRGWGVSGEDWRRCASEILDSMAAEQRGASVRRGRAL